MFVWLWLSGLAGAAETDCVTKDLAWRWLSVTAEGGATAKDRWVHGSKAVVEQAAGATGRLTWAADEASKVPFRSSTEGGAKVETFKWKVTLTATDGKPIAADVPESKVELTMHCQRTSGGGGGGGAAAAPKPATPKAEPKPAAAAPAPAPAKAEPAKGATPAPK